MHICPYRIQSPDSPQPTTHLILAPARNELEASNVLFRCIHDSFTSTPTHYSAPYPPGPFSVLAPRQPNSNACLTELGLPPVPVPVPSANFFDFPQHRYGPALYHHGPLKHGRDGRRTGCFRIHLISIIKLLEYS
jgi:hypothetical protein